MGFGHDSSWSPPARRRGIPATPDVEEATIDFARAARSAGVAIFYYSGRAMQFGGVNYLAPVDFTHLIDEADLRRMIRVNEIVADLQQAKPRSSN
jgi:uncharacterized caspase-like protein